jgi:hypothetical protein
MQLVTIIIFVSVVTDESKLHCIILYHIVSYCIAGEKKSQCITLYHIVSLAKKNHIVSYCIAGEKKCD